MRRKMMVLVHFDWGGTLEQLKDFDEEYKKTAEKTDGVKFAGRMIPMSKKYHFTMVLKMENMKRQSPFWRMG